MTTTVAQAVHVYDDFSGPSLDASRWDFFRFPLPDGGAYVCAEPSAVVDTRDGGLRIQVQEFENSHAVQPMDNVKHLLLSSADFPLAADGVTEISGEIAGRGINASARDYRDGFVSLVCIDMTTGYVFDLCATSDNVMAIYEQLPFPGVERPFTYVVEDPIDGVEIAEDRSYRCRIAFNAPGQKVTWSVDDVVVFESQVPYVPALVKIGLGIFTLHPTGGVQSRSLRGQGMAACWKNIGASVPASGEGR